MNHEDRHHRKPGEWVGAVLQELQQEQVPGAVLLRRQVPGAVLRRRQQVGGHGGGIDVSPVIVTVPPDAQAQGGEGEDTVV